MRCRAAFSPHGAEPATLIPLTEQSFLQQNSKMTLPARLLRHWLVRRIVDARGQVPIFEGLNARPHGVLLGHTWAYRDVLNDALTTLLAVRHARRLWTLLVKVP
ncbi:hypothetical protein CRG98_023441 [Punica granatum]|uniref:Uncharacterized protein n=1 Tax=Punica granatum TaxID=22663 RepID=A0A2I0JJN6_PUNGR|nr:hypothetical protein CRG98_023441 [Punica granatum]